MDLWTYFDYHWIHELSMSMHGYCGFPTITCLAGIQLVVRCTEVGVFSFELWLFSTQVWFGLARHDSARLASEWLGFTLLGAAQPSVAQCRFGEIHIFKRYTEVGGFCFECRSSQARLSLFRTNHARLSPTQLSDNMDPTWMDGQTRPPCYGTKKY